MGIDSALTSYGPPEHVFVENEWYDGPRSGIANVNGQPHRFVSQFDEADDEYLGTFLVWPIEPDELSLEQEQWQIFVDWNAQYEAGTVNVDSHPSYPGTNRRWDEIAALLESPRRTTPPHARRAKAQMAYLERQRHYEKTGPNYSLSWHLL